MLKTYKTLLVLAHPLEAHAFISSLALEKKKHRHLKLWENDNFLLLLTGEGPFEALSATSLTLGQFGEVIDNIYNIGIAGALDQDLQLESAHLIRSHYLCYPKGHPEFHSFHGMESGLVDCLTSFERFLEPKQSKGLRPFGSLVDREAWGIAKAASYSKRPFQSLKVVSDYLGNEKSEVCLRVKEKGHEWGEILFEKWQECYRPAHGGSVQDNDEDAFLNKILLIHSFHWTISQKRELTGLIDASRAQKLFESFQKSYPLWLKELQELEMRPKERSKEFLSRFNHLLFPEKAIWDKAFERISMPYLKEGVSVKSKDKFNSSKLQWSFHTSHQHDLEKVIRLLESFPHQRWDKLLNGEAEL